MEDDVGLAQRFLPFIVGVVDVEGEQRQVWNSRKTGSQIAADESLGAGD